MSTEPVTYAAAGVDIEAGDEAVRRITAHVESTRRPEVLGGIGGFGGMFELDLTGRRHPVLVAATDGVGTKLAVAKATGRLDTVGIDLVAMSVDDLVCCGAEPLFLLDYAAVATVNPDELEQIVAGIAEGCRQAGVSLLGGETAEHADTMSPGDFDLAAFAVGVVERDERLDPANVIPGDVLIGLPSPGLRSNGYTLARHVLLERAGLDLNGPAWDGATTSLADELLRPSVIYCRAVVAALKAHPGAIHAIAHITGGGIAGNLVRSINTLVDAHVDLSTIARPRIFDEIARLGPVDDAEMARVFNLGLGMALIVDGDDAPSVLEGLRGSGQEAVVVGSITHGTGTVEVHP